MITSDQAIHFEDLTRLFRDNTGAIEAAMLMEDLRLQRRTANLPQLLRHHDALAVTDPAELRMRSSFDLLLAFYSVLEMAALIGYISDEVPPKYKEQFVFDLDDPSLRSYFEVHYPVVLPQFYRARLRGSNRLHEAGAGDAASGLFSAFLSIESRTRDDEDLKLAFWFLDDGVVDGFCFEDVIQRLESPRVILEGLSKPRQRRDACDSGVAGFRKLIDFCLVLDDLLVRSSPYRLLQSAMWHHYGYYFDRAGGSLGNRTERVVQQMLKWPGSEGTEISESDHKALHDYVSQVTGTVRRLTSGQYGHALKEHYAEFSVRTG